jgi:hypothetical protein
VLTLAYPEVCERRLGVPSDKSRAHGRGPASRRNASGTLRGKHYTEYVEEVKTLRREGHEERAEQLLQELVQAVEAEAANEGWGVAPWYYEQLAIIYRKRKDRAAEVAILERYAQAPHAPGAGPEKLRRRLEKARLLAQRDGPDALRNRSPRKRCTARLGEGSPTSTSLPPKARTWRSRSPASPVQAGDVVVTRALRRNLTRQRFGTPKSRRSSRAVPMTGARRGRAARPPRGIPLPRR